MSNNNLKTTAQFNICTYIFSTVTSGEFNVTTLIVNIVVIFDGQYYGKLFYEC